MGGTCFATEAESQTCKCAAGCSDAQRHCACSSNSIQGLIPFHPASYAAHRTKVAPGSFEGALMVTLKVALPLAGTVLFFLLKVVLGSATLLI